MKKPPPSPENACIGVPPGSWFPSTLTKRPSAPTWTLIVCAGTPVVVLLTPPIVDFMVRLLNVIARSAVPEQSTDLTLIDSSALLSKLSGNEISLVVTVCVDGAFSVYLKVMPGMDDSDTMCWLAVP